MSSIGNGVNKDNSVPAQRLTFYNVGHADAQPDQVGIFQFDLSKIWACMGRAGVNGVMRDGLYERGDADTGYAAGSIMEYQGAAFGAEKWNTLNAYTLNGVNGDMVYIGGLAPFTDVMFHLAGTVVGPPTWVSEYWNGSAWTADTITYTPDFTGATGLNQRLRCANPNDWALKVDGGAGENRYWRRIRQTSAGAVVTLNTNYKDYIQGHMRDFFCAYDLKKGDDSTGTLASDFVDEFFILRIKATKRFDSRTTVNTFVQLGSVSNASRGRTLGGPWAIFSTRGHVIHPCKVYGGYIAGVPERFDSGTVGVALRGLNSEVIGTRIAGFMNNTLGASGATAVKYLDDVRVSPNRSGIAAGLVKPISNINIDLTSGFGSGLVVDQHDISVTEAITFSLNSGILAGVRITHDSGFQIKRTGAGGTLHLVDITWGGPNNKVIGSLASNNQAREWRFVTWRVWDQGTFVAMQGIPVRAKGSDGVIQLLGLTDVNGQGNNFVNAYDAEILPAGVQNNDSFLVEYWDNISGVSVVLDDPITFEINPADHANFNPAYQSITIKTKWPREMIYDATTFSYGVVDWQRINRIEVAIGLPLAVAPVAPAPAISINAVPAPAELVDRATVFLRKTT